jgi:hypothetical protein
MLNLILPGEHANWHWAVAYETARPEFGPKQTFNSILYWAVLKQAFGISGILSS